MRSSINLDGRMMLATMNKSIIMKVGLGSLMAKATMNKSIINSLFTTNKQQINSSYSFKTL